MAITTTLPRPETRSIVTCALLRLCVTEERRIPPAARDWRAGSGSVEPARPDPEGSGFYRPVENPSAGIRTGTDHGHSCRQAIVIELARGGHDGGDIDDRLLLGIRDEQGEVGDAVEAAGQAAAVVMEGVQGFGGEQGVPRAGGSQPALDVQRSLRFG